MRTLPFIYFVALCFLVFTGCRKPGCLGNAGKITTNSRALGSFNEIVLKNNIDLVLIQDTVESITVTAPENIAPNLTAEITNGALTIANTSDCRWARPADEKVRVQLHFKDIQRIDYRGSGNITNIDTIRVDGLKIETALGAGDIELTLVAGYTGAYIYQESTRMVLHGRADICYTYTNSRGLMDMSDFEVKSMVIEYGGLLDTKVHVTEKLDAIIYYKGNILYRGDPDITRQIYYSSGRVIKQP